MTLNRCRTGGPFTVGTGSYSNVSDYSFIWPSDPQDRHCAGSWESRNLRIQTGFRDVVNSWALNMNHFWHYYGKVTGGYIESIGTTGGVAYRSGCSYHPDGSAIDVHYIDMTGGYTIRPCKQITTQGGMHVRRYLGLEASLQKYFGETIDHWYNSAHDNHIHVSWVSPGYTGRVTQKRFLQAVMKYMGPTDPGSIDGIWGSGSRAAWRSFTETICAPVRDYPPSGLSEWRAVLDVITKTGFKDKAAGDYLFPGPCY